MASNLSFLFGNVDESGNIDDDDWNNEIKESLVKGSDYLSKAIGGFDLHISTEKDVEKSEILPTPTAVDFSEIDELAEESPTKTIHRRSLLPTISEEFIKPMAFELPDVIEAPKITIEKSMTVMDYFPNYKKDAILKFTDIFTPTVISKKRPPKKPTKKGLSRDKYFILDKDQRVAFFKPGVEIPDIDLLTSTDKKRKLSQETLSTSDAKKLMAVEIDDWENRIIWDEPMTYSEEKQSQLFLRNELLEDYDWSINVLYEDEESQPREIPSMQDPMLLPTILEEPKEPTSPQTKKLLDPFNISDDHFYETNKEKVDDRIRQTFGPIRLEHALPAVKLSFPFFKMSLSKSELRSHHRPHFVFPENQEIRFSKLKVSKIKRKDIKGKEMSELMRKAKDISLKDTARYVAMEYSEEHPPIMMNPGMASLIYNYYRKTDEKDTHTPQMAHGAAFVLEQVDASPFFNFGDVGKGQTIQCLYTNLFRAPIFNQKPPETDFLLIRNTSKTGARYYLREIPCLYLVGQTFPAMEVPRPHSRKISASVKARLQMAAFKLIRQDPLRRLKMDKLCQIFPEFTENQIRQRLREFATFERGGDFTGFWKLKPGIHLPSEDDLRKMMVPEMACLYESMLVGEQWLRDAGYAANIDFGEDEDDGEVRESIEIEVQLAPWTITRNFIQASQGRGMLKLFGAGDPTGIGEGFSFIRASMKELIRGQEEDKAAKSRAQYKISMAEQQQIYRQEIERIWLAQLESLSNQEDLDIMEEEENLDEPIKPEETKEGDNSKEDRMKSREMTPMAPSVSQLDRTNNSEADHEDTASMAGSLTSSKMTFNSGKILVINRLVYDDQGDLVWKSEVVTDSRVMSAYLRQRVLIEKEAREGDGDESVRRKKKTQDQLKKYMLQQKEKNNQPEEKTTAKIKLKLSSAGTSIKLKPVADEVKSHRKKKSKPHLELSAIFEGIIHKMMNDPHSYAFCKPVDPQMVPDYHQIITNPKSFSDILADLKQHKYRTTEPLLADIQLIADNCRTYNGPEHPLTHIIDRLVTQAQEDIERSFVDIKRLEKAIVDRQKAKEEKRLLKNRDESMQPQDNDQKSIGGDSIIIE